MPQFMAFFEDKGLTTGESIPLMWSGALSLPTPTPSTVHLQTFQLSVWCLTQS